MNDILKEILACDIVFENVFRNEPSGMSAMVFEYVAELVRNEDNAKALPVLQRIVSVDPHRVNGEYAYERMIDILAHKRCSFEIIQVANAALAKYPFKGYNVILEYCANAKVDMGDLTGGRADFDVALRKKSPTVAGYLGRGLLNMREKKYQEALSDFRAGKAVVRKESRANPHLAPADGKKREILDDLIQDCQDILAYRADKAMRKLVGDIEKTSNTKSKSKKNKNKGKVEILSETDSLIEDVKVNVEEKEEEYNDCIICMETTTCVMLNPCGHKILCEECAMQWLIKKNECPMCRGACKGFLPS